MKKFLLIILFICFVCNIQAQSREVPFTLDDRDRIIRTENDISSLRSEMNSRFEAQDHRFESLEKQLDRIYTLMFILLGAIFTLMGYVLWDRRTAVAPAQRDNKRIMAALIEYSKENPKLAEILRNSGIL